MTETPILRIPDAPPPEDTLNFRTLMLAGTRLAQGLTGDLWTDYNEHDPGVTILEALCYALTDLGYRTSHPFADILASSMAATQVKLSEQPLFTGNELLSCAAVTANDYRKLVYDAVPDVRNVWIRPVVEDAGRVSGLYDVDVQLFADVPPDRIAAQAALARQETALSLVRALLTKNRNLGEDFREIRAIPDKLFTIDAVIALAPGTNAEAAVARMIFDVEMRLNPVPELEEIGKLMDAGIAPDAIFSGPRLDHGRIADTSLQPLRSEIPPELVLGVMKAVPGVESITNFALMLKEPTQHHARSMAPALSRSDADLSRMVVLRNGAKVRLQPDQVLLHLRHIEERLRWQAALSMQRTTDMAYARVPTGKPDRQLSKYRSIQHLFPGVYGIGTFGVAAKDAALESAPLHRDRKNAALEATERHWKSKVARAAEARQLKGYLLFFEQLLADYLAQLENTAQLYSFRCLDQTYFFQPLARPGSGDPDEPPDIAPVLGETPDQRKRGTLDTDPSWFTDYQSGLKALTKACDPAAERQNRLLDHMLARFNERFDTDALWRLTRDRHKTPAAFHDWLGARKRGFLAELPTISAGRGLGVDLLDFRPTALERRIALKTGMEGEVLVVEHVLLRDFPAETVIGTMQIGVDFRIVPARPIRAFRVTAKDIGLHLIVDQVAPGDHTGLRDRLCTLGADRRNFHVFPHGGHQLSVRLDDGAGTAFEILENFRSSAEAETAITRLAAGCAAILAEVSDHGVAIRPAIMPTAFFRMGVGVFLPDQNRQHGAAHADDGRVFTERVVAENIPAHLDHLCFWLGPTEFAAFRSDWTECVDALGVLRRTSQPVEACRARARSAVGRIRQWIDECYCRDILCARRTRRDGIRQVQST